jgi:hypothetical protein
MISEKNKNIVCEVLGWYGTIAIVSAYLLNSFGQISSSSFQYQILNATGAIGIIVISMHKKVYQSAVLNIIWLLIAVIALFQILF